VKHPRSEAIQTPFAPLLATLNAPSGPPPPVPTVGWESTTLVGCGPDEVSPPPFVAPPPPLLLPAAAGVLVAVAPGVAVCPAVGVGVGLLDVCVAVGVAVGGDVSGVAVGVSSSATSLTRRAAWTSPAGVSCIAATQTHARVSKPNAAARTSIWCLLPAFLTTLRRPLPGMPKTPTYRCSTCPSIARLVYRATSARVNLAGLLFTTT